MKTLTECRTDGERLMLLLNFKPGYDWVELLLRGVIYFTLLVGGAVLVMSGVMAVFGE